MNRNFFVLRARQIVRYLAELGLLRSVFVFGAMAYLFFFLAFEIAKGHNAPFIFALFAVLTLALQIGRTDKDFLKEMQVSCYPLFAVEYLVLLFPLMLIFLIYGEYTWCLASIGTALIVPLVPGSYAWGRGGEQETDLTLGLQSNFSFVLFFYLLALAFFQEAVVVLVASFALSVLLTVAVPDLPTDDELLSGTIDIKPLIWSNIGKKLKMLALMFLPLAVLFMTTNYRYGLSMLFFLIATAFLHIFSILMSYSHYRPNYRKQKSPLLIALGAFIVYMPWISPIIPLWSIYYYYRAVKNLSI